MRRRTGQRRHTRFRESPGLCLWRSPSVIFTKGRHAGSPKGATQATARVNREAVGLYDLENRQDFLDADRGFIAPIPGALTGPDGHTIFFDTAPGERKKSEPLPER